MPRHPFLQQLPPASPRLAESWNPSSMSWVGPGAFTQHHWKSTWGHPYQVSQQPVQIKDGKTFSLECFVYQKCRLKKHENGWEMPYIVQEMRRLKIRTCFFPPRRSWYLCSNWLGKCTSTKGYSETVYFRLQTLNQGIWKRSEKRKK